MILLLELWAVSAMTRLFPLGRLRPPEVWWPYFLCTHNLASAAHSQVDGTAQRATVRLFLALPDVLRRKCNHYDCHDYQCGHLHPEVTCKAAFGCGLSIHCWITSLRPMACSDYGDPREATRAGKAKLVVASLSWFLGFRHCRPARFAVVGA